MYFYFFRLLNICLHVIDNVTPGAHSAKVSTFEISCNAIQPRSRTVLRGFGKCGDAFSSAIFSIYMYALRNPKILFSCG